MSPSHSNRDFTHSSAMAFSGVSVSRPRNQSPERNSRSARIFGAAITSLEGARPVCAPSRAGIKQAIAAEERNVIVLVELLYSRVSGSSARAEHVICPAPVAAHGSDGVTRGECILELVAH